MENGKYADANKSLELLMKAKGMFKGIENTKSLESTSNKQQESRFKESSTNNTPEAPVKRELSLAEQLQMAIEKATSSDKEGDLKAV
jgi:hypothetical protein